MDRLTNRINGIPYIKRDSGGSVFMRDADIKAVQRLAAYEDTGLTPAECAEVKKLCADYVDAGLDAQFVQVCIDTARLGISTERMWELARAESEGRLIVLPENWKDLCGRKGMQLYTIYEGDVYDAAITDVYIDENGEGRFAYAVFPSEDPFDSEWLDEPVSRFWDVLFRTYDEAEAACKIDETEL